MCIHGPKMHDPKQLLRMIPLVSVHQSFPNLKVDKWDLLLAQRHEDCVVEPCLWQSTAVKVAKSRNM